MTRLTKLSRSISGKTALVTGAASGMGLATARLFVDEGARVAMSDINAQLLQSAVEEIKAAGYEVRGFPCDVGNATACKKLIADVVSVYGGLDILINNAGITGRCGATTPEAEFEETWQRAIAVNLTAHARLIRAALPYLQAGGAGRIVNIASTEALIATAGMVDYTAGKHGVIGLTKSFAVELGAAGVTVNCICPGPIDTAMTSPIPAAAKQKYARRRVPLRRYGDPEEVAHGTLSLVLPASSFINGAVLVIDGGMTIRHT